MLLIIVHNDVIDDAVLLPFYLTLTPFPVGLLKQLEDLDLSDNVSLKDVPASFGDLTKLKKFYMKGTLIEMLPYELQYCTELVELIMKDNSQIMSMPGTKLVFC